MALRHQRQLAPAARRPAASDQERELAELAQRTGHPTSVLARVSPAYRQSWLVQLRRDDADRAQHEITAFKAQLASITSNADGR